MKLLLKIQNQREVTNGHSIILVDQRNNFKLLSVIVWSTVLHFHFYPNYLFILFIFHFFSHFSLNRAKYEDFFLGTEIESSSKKVGEREKFKIHRDSIFSFLYPFQTPAERARLNGKSEVADLIDNFQVLSLMIYPIWFYH